MEIFFLTILFIFGMLFGSFGSVIIYRFRSGEKGILNGRSHCAKCNHILNTLDLIPIFSWIFNKGKCKYCYKKISSIYPILELSTGLLFSLIGYFLIDINLIINLDLNEYIKLLFWLSIGFFTIIYTFYDILFLEIHDGIMLSAILLAIIFIVLQSFGIIEVIPSLISFSGYTLSNIIANSILIISIGLLYIIMLKELKEIYDILLLIFIIGLSIIFNIYFIDNIQFLHYIGINSLIGVLTIFIFFFLQIIVSGGKWLGGGDLRIAILIGLLLGFPLSIAGLFLTYFSGSIISIIVLIYQKLITKKINTQIPFGPFLAIGFFITIFFQNNILSLIEIYL